MTGRADAGTLSGRAWLAALPDELAAQRRVLAGLASRCEAWPLALSLLVGCSLGRGAADALSDIDAALGVDAPPGEAGAERVDAAEALVTAALPELGALVDVLRDQDRSGRRYVRRIFAQFEDGTQLDLAVVADAEIEARSRAGGAPDFIPVYQAWPGPGDPPASRQRPRGRTAAEPAAAYAVTGEQVREWAFRGWCALIDADKYLRRGSLWEAHSRLHEARHRIWMLWAAAHGALYPWHGLSQVLDHDPGEPAAGHRVHRGRTRRARTAPGRPRQRGGAHHRQRRRRPAAPGRPAGGDGRLRHPGALPRTGMTPAASPRRARVGAHQRLDQAGAGGRADKAVRIG